MKNSAIGFAMLTLCLGLGLASPASARSAYFCAATGNTSPACATPISLSDLKDDATSPELPIQTGIIVEPVRPITPDIIIVPILPPEERSDPKPIPPSALTHEEGDPLPVPSIRPGEPEEGDPLPVPSIRPEQPSVLVID